MNNFLAGFLGVIVIWLVAIPGTLFLIIGIMTGNVLLAFSAIILSGAIIAGIHNMRKNK